MKISITIYENTVTYESSNEDCTSTEALEIYLGLLRTIGYQEISINKSLKELCYENLRNE